MIRRRRLPVRLLLLGGLLALAFGCASEGAIPDPLLDRQAETLSTIPLAGESLSALARELARAHRDLLHFHVTLAGLRDRRDRNGTELFEEFLDGYLLDHLAPLLANEWQSRQPELMVVDANIRLLYADLLVGLGRPQQMQGVVDEIQKRFAEQESMLVDYPVGRRTTLRKALETLHEREWWS
jgi:hypothetical protein